MGSIYRSSKNDQLIKESGPHKEHSTDKFFVNNFSINIDFLNYVGVDNIMEIGKSIHGTVTVDINEGLLSNK